jgi:hypothetical protein
MNQDQVNALDNHYSDYSIEEVSGIGYRYQARERGQIIAFFGYADTQEEAQERLLAKCEVIA